MIPDDWEERTLQNCALGIVRGASPRPIDDPKWFDDRSPVGWLRISDVTSAGRFLTTTTQRLSEAGIRHSRKVPAGSLVMSICATVGRPIETRIDVCIHDGFVLFDKPDVEQDFLYHVLTDLEPRWTKKGQTGSQMNLNTGLIKGTKIAVPKDGVEQSAIATALSDVDALLAAQDALITKKRAIKQGAMQELLTGKRRLPGFDGEWEETNFTSITRQHSGNSALIKGRLPNEPLSGLFPAYSASGQDVWCSHFEHEGNALIVSAVGSRCGKAFLARGKWSAIANTHVIWPDETQADPGFVNCFLNNEDFWLKGGTGQPFVLVRLSLLQMVALPPLEEQKAIVRVLSDMDIEITALETKRDKTAQLKQGMMQELLTGRIRLV